MNKISNIKLKFACNADWDSMEYVDGVKHCDHCQKKVYDFTDAKPNEFLKILAENNNNICGRFKQEQMATSHIGLPAWKKCVSAALVLIGINIFSNKAEAQNVKHKTETVNFPPPLTILGDVEVLQYDSVAHFPGGDNALKKFLINNLHFTEKMITGRVFVQFTVNKDGSLNNYQIMRGLSKSNDDEVIRVLKLSPKWHPAMLKGKPVISNYTVPVNFQK